MERSPHGRHTAGQSWQASASARKRKRSKAGRTVEHRGDHVGLALNDRSSLPAQREDLERTVLRNRVSFDPPPPPPSADGRDGGA